MYITFFKKIQLNSLCMYNYITQNYLEQNNSKSTTRNHCRQGDLLLAIFLVHL